MGIITLSNIVSMIRDGKLQLKETEMQNGEYLALVPGRNSAYWGDKTQWEPEQPLMIQVPDKSFLVR